MRRTLTFLFIIIIAFIQSVSIQAQFIWRYDTLSFKPSNFELGDVLNILRVENLENRHLVFGYMARYKDVLIDSSIVKKYCSNQFIGYTFDSLKTISFNEIASDTLCSSKQGNTPLIDYFSLLNNTSGMAVGGQSLYSSTDSFKTWQKRNFVDSNFTGFRDVVNNRKNVFVVNTYQRSGVMGYTHDYGKIWNKINAQSSKTDSASYGGLYLPYFSNDSTLNVLRQAYEPYYVQYKSAFVQTRSTDLGKTWIHLGSRVQGYEGDSSNGIWMKEIVQSKENLNVVYGIGMCGNFGYQAIFKTTNGGDSWVVVDSISEAYPYHSVQLFGEDTLYATTFNGKVRGTYNGGKSFVTLCDEHVVNPNGEKVQLISFVHFFSPWHGILRTSAVIDKYRGSYQHNLFITPTTTVEGTEEYAHLWINNLSPQPAQNTITIKGYIDTRSSAGDVSLIAYNSMGEKVADYTSLLPQSTGINTLELPLDVQHLANGVYVLVLRDAKQTLTRSFIRMQ